MAVGRIDEEAALVVTFSYEKRCGRFAKKKYIGRNIEVAVLASWP